MKRLVFILIIPILYVYSSALDNLKIKNEIQEVLDYQKTLWNEGNIEGFMRYYWNSEKFTFQSGNKRIHGWEALLSRYKKNYSGENQGKLSFTDVDIKVLSNTNAFVIGRWKIVQKETLKEGLFTLIFQRMPEGWRIIHDHTS